MGLADYYTTLKKYCEASYMNYLRVFMPLVMQTEEVVWNWHMPVLAAEFERQARRFMQGLPKEYDVVTNITPGTSKSSIFSVYPTGWLWTQNPKFRFISACFSGPLSLSLSSQARNVVRHPLYQKLWPHIQLSDDKDRLSDWGNTAGGSRYACTVGGSVMGMHGDIISIDDPLDPTGGRSKAELDKARQWCKETIPSRKTDKERSVTFLTMQRIHMQDPTELFLTRGTPVKHYCLPPKLSRHVRPREMRQYYKDGMFDPVRLPQAVLDNLKLELGTYAYGSQIEQNPCPPEGSMFDTQMLLTRVKPLPPLSEFRLVRAWDKAITDGAGKYTCGVMLGVHNTGQLWIIDVRRGQWGADKRNALIKATAQADGAGCPVTMEEEPGSSGKLDSLVSVRSLSGFKVTPIRPTGSKELRADIFSAHVNAGNVYLPMGAPWIWAYVDELANFPNGEYSDQVDASSLAYDYMFRKRKPGVM